MKRALTMVISGNPAAKFILAALVVCIVFCTIVLVGCSTTPRASTVASESKVQLLFVQTSEQISVDPASKTLRLVKVNPQTLYFSDRPERIAGHLKIAEYLEEWTAAAGKDNFAKNPPNAVLSVYEPGNPDTTLTVVTINNPRVDGADLVYGYKLVSGTLPTGAGETSLFIDSIGVGGGVGVGYHGVGVGRRGVGVR